MSEAAIQVLLLFLLIFINGLFSMTEMAVVSSRRARLQNSLEDGDQRAKTVLDLLDNPNDFFSTIQIAITLIGVITGAIGAQTFSHYLVDILVRVSFLKGIAQPLSVLLRLVNVLLRPKPTLPQCSHKQSARVMLKHLTIS